MWLLNLTESYMKTILAVDQAWILKFDGMSLALGLKPLILRVCSCLFCYARCAVVYA